MVFLVPVPVVNVISAVTITVLNCMERRNNDMALRNLDQAGDTQEHPADPPSFIASQQDTGEDTEPPPPYSERQAGSAIQELLQTLREETAEAQNRCGDPAKQLQNFLLHCLMTDYKVHPAPVLRERDAVFYGNIGQYILDTICLDDWSEGCGEPGRMLQNCLDVLICSPARVLNLPINPVAEMVLLFRRATSWTDYYRGAWPMLPSIQEIALKLLIDRNLMINAIVPASNPNLRMQLFSALNQKQSYYFTSLDSVDSYTLTERGKQKEKNTEQFGQLHATLRNSRPEARHRFVSTIVGQVRRMHFWESKKQRKREKEKREEKRGVGRQQRPHVVQEFT